MEETYADVHLCSVFMSCSQPADWTPSAAGSQVSGVSVFVRMYARACVHMVAASEVAPVVHSWHRDSII